MTSRLEDYLNARGENEKLPADPRTPDGNPSTDKDVVPSLPRGNAAAQATYSVVSWNTDVPTRALTDTTTREAQAREPEGFMEVLTITQRRGDPSNGILAPNAAGVMTSLAPRTYA